MRTITTFEATKTGLVPRYEHWISYGFWVLVMIRQWELKYNE